MTFVKRKNAPNSGHRKYFLAEGILKELCVSVPGIGHSDIRGLVTYRSMVRRERYRLTSWITLLCHHRFLVDRSNLEKPKLLQDAFRFFNMAALQPLITRYRSGLGMSRPEPRQRCEAALILPERCDTSCNIAGHHAPDEAGQFSGNSSFCHIAPLVLPKNHLVILPSKTFVSTVCIGDNLWRISRLTLFQSR